MGGWGFRAERSRACAKTTKKITLPSPSPRALTLGCPFKGKGLQRLNSHVFLGILREILHKERNLIHLF